MSQNIAFPVKIDGLTFFEQSFSAKGCEHPYATIKSLKFQIMRTSINFSTNETYVFAMRTSDDEVIGISVSDAAFSFNKKKVADKKNNLLSVANHINQTTFQQRFDGYLDQLRTNGYLQYKTPTNSIFIYGNGDVSLAGKTVNVKRAKEAGTLKFGTAYGFGSDRSINPFEVSINEKPPILGGRAEGFGSVKFDAGWDFPMIFEILESMQ